MLKMQQSALGSRALTPSHLPRVGTARPTLIARSQAKVTREVDVQPSPPKPAAPAAKKRSAQLDALYAISGEWDDEEPLGPPGKAKAAAKKPAAPPAAQSNEGFREEPADFYDSGAHGDFSMDDDDAFDWRDKKGDVQRTTESNMGSWDESFDEQEYQTFVAALEGEKKGKDAAAPPKK